MADAAFTVTVADGTTTVTCERCGLPTTGSNTDLLIAYMTDDHQCPPITEPIPTPEPETRIANPTDDDEQEHSGATGNPGTVIQRHRPTFMHRGRTPMWADSRILDKIVDAIAGGCYMTTAATAAGINRQTLFNWLQQADQPGAPPELVDFHNRVTRARAMAEETAVEMLWDVARGGHLIRRSTRNDATGDGYVVEETFTAPDAKPVMFLLERSFPQRWGRRSTLDVGMNPDGPAHARANEDDSERLDALAQRAADALKVVRGGAEPESA